MNCLHDDPLTCGGKNADKLLLELLQVLLLMRNLTINLSSPEFEPIVSGYTRNAYIFSLWQRLSF